MVAKHRYIRCCEFEFFIRIAGTIALVLFAGLMSGLTLGLMSMSIVDLEVIAISGKPKDRLDASKILPVVKRHHLLLCTLLLSNAAAMETLPLFLNALVPDWIAILLAVTLILLFGEIIPQSVCSQYGLAIGAAVIPVVHALVWFWFPVAYPISKLLDLVLGKEHVALLRRAELKTLVDMHGNEAGKGGELSRNETTIIAGALELTTKTAKDVMTPLSDVFALDMNAELDRDLMNLILEKGHSRVPVYIGQKRNITGLIMVKDLLTVKPREGILIKNVAIRKIPRVSESRPLYDILNEFQKGVSHMAAVIREENFSREASSTKEVRANTYNSSSSRRTISSNMRKLIKLKCLLANKDLLPGEVPRSRRWSKHDSHVLHIDEISLPSLTEKDEVIGIITMEDIIEELLKEEIYDETD